MNKSYPLIISIGAGVAAVLLFQFYLKNEKVKLYQGMTLVEAAAVTRDIASGTLLEESDVAKKEIPTRYLHEKGVLYSEISQIIGQPLKYPVKNGEILLWTGIGGRREKTLSGLVVKGERGVTVGVDDINGMNGLIHPGDRVDILGTFYAGGLGKEGADLKMGEATVMLLQNVQVLATGSQTGGQKAGSSEEGSGYSGITVSVSPEESALLVLSQQRGKLTMVLRNMRDTEVLRDLPKVTYDDIKLGKALRYLLKERNQKVIEIPAEGR